MPTTRVRRPGVLVLFLFCGLVAACGHAPTAPDPAGDVKINGSIGFVTVEGGFWAIRGDDGVTYDPLGGLPAAFQREGMRVFLEARRRNDLGGIHMAGPIVEIVRIVPLS